MIDEPDDPLSVPLLSYKKAFELLGVGKTLGHEMLNDGRLERVRLGRRRCAVTTESIRRLIAGSAPLPPRSPPSPTPRQSAPMPETTPAPEPRLIKRPRS